MLPSNVAHPRKIKCIIDHGPRFTDDEPSIIISEREENAINRSVSVKGLHELNIDAGL